MDAQAGGAGLIGFSHVDKAYGERVVMQDFSLALPEAGSVALMGPSGSGKTTLLRMLAGLTAPDRGQIFRFEGQKVAFQFQEDRLLPWYTVRRNLELFCPGQSGRWLAEMELSAEGEKLPGELSGGMRRRVALARALCYDAPVLLLDEPLKEMDARLRERMVALIGRSSHDRLLIMVTHNPAEAQALCERIITLAPDPLRVVE